MSYAEDADRLQGNTAKLYYFAEKDRLVWFMCFWGLGFVCVNQRDLRETLGVHLCG